MKVALKDPRQVDIRVEIASIDVARAEGQGEEMRRRLATEMEALRRPYHDDPWPWIMIVITVVMGSIIVAAIRLPEILHAFGFAAMPIDHLTVLVLMVGADRLQDAPS
jgi:hypothetical protein